MSYFKGRIDTFSPVQWETGKNNEEKCHWLGHFVEPYFDLGQQSYIVEQNSSLNGIPVSKDSRELTWQQTALKVISIIFKVLSYLTLVLPLIMLIGKVIYRSKNIFVLEDKIDPEEHERMAKQIFQRYSKENHGSHYTRLAESIDHFALGSCDTPEALDAIDNLHREVEMVKGEAARLKALKGASDSDEFYNNLDEVILDLSELLEKFDAYLESNIPRQQILDALEASYLHALQALTDYKKELAAWEVVQEETLKELRGEDLDSIQDEDLLQHFNELVRQSQEMRGYQLGTHTPIEKFLKHHDLCKKLIPDFKAEEKYDSMAARASQELMPKGIRNLGNTCYMNSLLQAISNEPVFINHLNHHFEDNELANRIVHTLKVFVSAHRSGDKNAIIVAAMGVRELLLDLGVIQNRSQQNDSSEVLQVLMMFSQFPTFQATIEKIYEEGKLKGSVSSKDELNSLSVAIKSSPNNIDSDFLQGLVDKNFMKKEMSDRLKVKEDPDVFVKGFEEQVFFDTAPENLVLSVKRFQREAGVTSKISEQINLPINGLLDLTSAFKNGVVPDGGSPMYEITSVIKHHGGFGGGHYTGSVKKGNDWVRVNDSRVTDHDTDIDHDAYVYFLRRVKV